MLSALQVDWETVRKAHPELISEAISCRGMQVGNDNHVYKRVTFLRASKKVTDP